MVKGKHRRDNSPDLCLMKGHHWQKNSWTGRPLTLAEHDEAMKDWKYGDDYVSHKDEVQHYHCARSCGSHKYEMLNWGRELTREERAVERIRFRGGMAATMWMLDNVQPAYSSDGTGYGQEDNDNG